MLQWKRRLETFRILADPDIDDIRRHLAQ